LNKLERVPFSTSQQHGIEIVCLSGSRKRRHRVDRLGPGAHACGVVRPDEGFHLEGGVSTGGARCAW